MARPENGWKHIHLVAVPRGFPYTACKVLIAVLVCMLDFLGSLHNVLAKIKKDNLV